MVRSATKADIVAYNAMVKTARERVEKLFNEGKTEAEVIAADPLKDLNATWAADAQGGDQLPQAGLQLVQALIAAPRADCLPATSRMSVVLPASVAVRHRFT